jgi:hypothetical protein
MPTAMHRPTRAFRITLIRFRRSGPAGPYSNPDIVTCLRRILAGRGVTTVPSTRPNAPPKAERITSAQCISTATIISVPTRRTRQGRCAFRRVALAAVATEPGWSVRCSVFKRTMN